MGNGQKEIRYSDQELVEKIRQGDEQAFKHLFFCYYPDLCGFATQMINSKEQGKDIVQEVFCTLWKRRKKWYVHTSVKAYLFQSVRNETLNQLDREKHQEDIRTKWSQESTSDISMAGTDEAVGKREYLVDQIWKLVSGMPERRQSVFVLHRKHGLSYKEIADTLEITRKTVENHMGLALSDIREQLNRQQVHV